MDWKKTLKRLFLIDLLTGLWRTFSYQGPSSCYTEQYPQERPHFTYALSRCMFCGCCEDACPTDALELTQDFELAYYTRQGAIWDRHLLEEGPTPVRYTR